MTTVTNIKIMKTLQDCGARYLDYNISAHDVAICMLLVKVARLKHRPTEDCYIDMAGYAAIAGEINDRKEDDTDTTISTTK
jgi:hypothetical protein